MEPPLKPKENVKTTTQQRFSWIQITFWRHLIFIFLTCAKTGGFRVGFGFGPGFEFGFGFGTTLFWAIGVSSKKGETVLGFGFGLGIGIGIGTTFFWAIGVCSKMGETVVERKKTRRKAKPINRMGTTNFRSIWFCLFRNQLSFIFYPLKYLNLLLAIFWSLLLNIVF